VCHVANRVDVGDHVLVIARVTAGAVLHEGKPTVHVRKSGLRY
jgi:flavin reductase (DIM6/NTAB) family NADH-FMN oxidoreductase RutF